MAIHELILIVGDSPFSPELISCVENEGQVIKLENKETRSVKRKMNNNCKPEPFSQQVQSGDSASSPELKSTKPCMDSENEITTLFENRETRPVKRKIENNDIVNSKNSKPNTFSNRAISEQLPFGNKGRIDVVENGEMKTISK